MDIMEIFYTTKPVTLTNTPHIFHVETKWNTRGVFVGIALSMKS